MDEHGWQRLNMEYHGRDEMHLSSTFYEFVLNINYGAILLDHGGQ